MRIRISIFIILTIVVFMFIGCEENGTQLVDKAITEEYEDYNAVTATQLTNKNIISQLRMKSPKLLQNNGLAKAIDEDLEFDYSNTLLVESEEQTTKTLVSPQVIEGNSKLEYLYYNTLDDTAIMDNGIILGWDEDASTIYVYSDTGILLGATLFYSEGGFEMTTYIQEGVGMDELFSFWDTFKDCWGQSMSSDQAVIGGLVAIPAGFGCVSCAWGAGAIGGGIAAGCLAAAYVLT